MATQLIYIAFAPLTLILLLLLYMHTNPVLEERIIKYLKAAAVLSIVQTCTVTADILLNSYYASPLFRTFIKACELSCYPLIILMLFLSINKDTEKYALAWFFPAIANTVIAFSGLFCKIAFHYSKNQFFRGPLGYTCYAISFLYLALFLYATAFSQQFSSPYKPVMLIFFAAINIGTLIIEKKCNVPGLISSSIAISVIVFYLYLQTLVLSHDSLTGAFSRRCFYIDSRKHAKDITAIISLDLNNLKMLNDTKGHAEGDRVICLVSNIIGNCLLNGCSLYRMGGDEFVIICLGHSPEALNSMMENIRSTINSTGHNCAMGIACANDHDNIDTLCARSDSAMYVDKYLAKQSLSVTARQN